MARANKIYKGDVGTAIILDTGEDLSEATAVSMAVRKPDGTVAIWSAEVVQVEGARTGVRHLVQAGELDQEGIYRLQAVVTLPGWTGRTQTAEMKVWEEFK